MGDLIENGIKTVQIRPHYVLKFREKKLQHLLTMKQQKIKIGAGYTIGPASETQSTK